MTSTNAPAKGKLLGKGLFSKVYENTNEPCMVIIETVDHAKECMAHGWFPDSDLFPTVTPTDECGVYTMRYYASAKSKGVLSELDAHNKALYRALRKLSVHVDNPYDRMHAWCEAFASLPDQFATEREALREACEACGNYGSQVAFEISPRNVATENGKLVLLDCFFMVDQAEQLRGR